MSKFKESKFYKKMRSLNFNRTTLVTVITVVIVAAAVIAITVAANRAHRKELPDNMNTPTNTQGAQTTKKPEATTAAPDKNTPSTPTVNKLPDFTLPAVGVLSSKHDPDLQVYSSTMNDYRVHLGIDINTTDGAPVYAAADGKVEKIWEDPLMGHCVALSHSGNAVTVYKNMNKLFAEGIKEGASVKGGQLLGAVGDSAMVEVAAEPHLHFEMTVDGVEVDPLKYFTEDAVASLGTDVGYEK